MEWKWLFRGCEDPLGAPITTHTSYLAEGLHGDRQGAHARGHGARVIKNQALTK